jgi:hypothetical protein
MFGSFPFGVTPWSPSPQVYRMILEADGVVTAEAGVDAAGSALASGAGVAFMSSDITGGLAAIRSATGDVQADTSSVALGSVVWNAAGVLSLLTDLDGRGSALVSAAGIILVEVLVEGVRLRAYDALFPPAAADGSVVQIGKRLYRWRTTSARWSFYMVAPTNP